MAVKVGNVAADPLSNSFISLADAIAYLEPEAAVAGTGSPLEQFMAADTAKQEGALVRASRWLAGAFEWHPMTEASLIRLGHVAARLAAEGFGRETFAGVDAAGVIQSETVGPISVTYRDGVRADAGGLAFDWLRPMLRGLIASGNTAWLTRA
ncbi:hypothetical protein [Paracoccus sp. SY]|uniref:hypothetical protein n=1 Tax=Paracoccus sp. SY TaxID=1330255 RepID=UPI000CD05BDA|nr:hypothetical protein [Paracoccus sp. SY]